MKKTNFKSPSGNTSKSSLGNSKGFGSSSYGRSSSAQFSSGSGNAFGKSSSSSNQFKRSISADNSSNYSRDKKPLSDNSWKTSKPKCEKIASGSKSSIDSWGSIKTKSDNRFNSGSKCSTDSNWTAVKPKTEKLISKGSTFLANNNIGSTKPKYQNSLSVGSQFSAENSWTLTKPKYEKSLSAGTSNVGLVQIKSPAKNSINKEQKVLFDSNNSSNKTKYENAACLSSYYKGQLEKSKSNFQASSVATSSSTLTAGKSTKTTFNHLNSSIINNKTTDKCNVDLYSSLTNNYSVKTKAKTSGYLDSKQTSHPKEEFAKASGDSTDRINKSRDRSTNNIKITRSSPEIISNNDHISHHFYDNLSKLFHHKGNSQSKQEFKKSPRPAAICLASEEMKETSLYGSPSMNAQSYKPIATSILHESTLKETSSTNKKIYNLKPDSGKQTLSGNSHNLAYPNFNISVTNNCTNVTIFGSAVSDTSNHSPTTYRPSTSSIQHQNSSSPDIHAIKTNHGIGLNIFGHLFSKHSGEKKANKCRDNFNIFPSTSMGSNKIKADLIQQHHNLDFHENNSGSVDCKDSINKSLSSSEITKAKKSCSFKIEAPTIVTTDVAFDYENSTYSSSTAAKIQEKQKLDVENFATVSKFHEEGFISKDIPNQSLTKNGNSNNLLRPNDNPSQYLTQKRNSFSSHLPNGNKTQSGTHKINSFSKDSHRKFDADEKTKVIAELLRSYCLQQGKEICRENGLKPVPNPLQELNKLNGVSTQISSISNAAAKQCAKADTPVASVNQYHNIQSINISCSDANSNIIPSKGNKSRQNNSYKESLKSGANIKGPSLNQIPTLDQANLIPAANHNPLVSVIKIPNSNCNNAASESDLIINLPGISNLQCNGVRQKVNTPDVHSSLNAEVPVTPDHSNCISQECKNGHFQFLKPNNLLSSFNNLTHVISTGPLKKSHKEQQITPKRKVGVTSVTESSSFNNSFISTLSGVAHGGIIPSHDNENSPVRCQTPRFLDLKSTKKINKCNKQKHISNVDMHHNHATPFMINSRGHQVPVSSHARDAILSALMFSSINSYRKKNCTKPLRCGNRQHARGNPNDSVGLSALGLALPRASSQPDHLMTHWDWEECDHTDDPLPDIPFVMPCSASENDLLVEEDYFKEMIVKSHTVDAFRGSYEKATQVIKHGRELLAAGNYLQACVEFEVGLKLMDCILESRIDDSDMSPLDKTICISVQEVIRVDRKSALEGYSDAQAGYVAPRQEQSQTLPNGAPSAPPSYTDVLREDLEKNFFSCGTTCVNPSQNNVMEMNVPGTSAPSAPSEELSDNFPQLPPSYELHETDFHYRHKNSSCKNPDSTKQRILAEPSSVPQLPTVTPSNLETSLAKTESDNIPLISKTTDDHHSLVSVTQTLKNSIANEKCSVDSVICGLCQNLSENTDKKFEKRFNTDVANNGAAVCKQPNCPISASLPSSEKVAAAILSKNIILQSAEVGSPSEEAKYSKPRFIVCPVKSGLLSLQNAMECSNVSGNEQNIKQLNDKEKMTRTIVDDKSKEAKITEECGNLINEKNSQSHSCKADDSSKTNSNSTSKPLNVSDVKFFIATTSNKKPLLCGKSPSPLSTYPLDHLPSPPSGQVPPPPPSGQMPPLPPSSASATKCLEFPPDVEVSKENSSGIANLKVKCSDRKSNLTKDLNSTEMENIYVCLKDCQTPNSDGKLKEVLFLNAHSTRISHLSSKNVLLNANEEKEMSQAYGCKSKIVKSGNESSYPLFHERQISSSRTIVLDPFIFEDPFADGSIYRNHDEEEPFPYDDEPCNFCIDQNELEIIFPDSLSLDCYDHKLPLVSSFTNGEFNGSNDNKSVSSLRDNLSWPINEKSFSKTANQYANNMETYLSQPKVSFATNSNNDIAARPSQTSTTESNHSATYRANKDEIPESNTNGLQSTSMTSSNSSSNLTNKKLNDQFKSQRTNNTYINQPSSHIIPCKTKDIEVSSFRENCLVNDRIDEAFSSKKNQQIEITEHNFRNYERVNENLGSKSAILLENSPNLHNITKLNSQVSLQPCDSEFKEKAMPIYQNIRLESSDFERIDREERKIPTTVRVNANNLLETNDGSSSTLVTPVTRTNPVTSHISEGSTSKLFNSRLELNMKKGFLKSLSFPSFIFKKTNRQSSDEGRLIGQSSFFVDFEAEKGGAGWVSIMRLKDVKVFFIGPNQNVTSPSINQIITIREKKDKLICVGSEVCMEIGKKLWSKNLNVASTNILKTINKLYIIEAEAKADFHVAIELSSKTKFALIEQLEEILRKNSIYQTEVLAQSLSLREHRKIIKKMDNFIKEKSPAFYFQAHDFSRKSTRAVRNAATSLSKGIMNFHNDKLTIDDAPNTSPLTKKLYGQMENLQIKARLLEEAQWKNLVVPLN